jgi:hypothetical protein
MFVGAVKPGNSFSVPSQVVFAYIIQQSQAGGTVGIVLGIAGYLGLIGICVRFLQFSHERDTAMHVITADWMENSPDA